MEHAMEHYSEKKRKLLDASLQLMLAKGYHATTVDEICEVAKVTKGSYFHYFKSKEDAAKETLTYFGRLQQGMLQNAGIEQEQDSWTRLQKFLDFYVLVSRNPDLPKSCLASTFAQELAEDYPELRMMCEANFGMNAQPLIAIITDCKQDYMPQAVFDPATVAEYFISLYQGSLILAKAKQDPTIIATNVEQFRAYTQMLFHKS